VQVVIFNNQVAPGRNAAVRAGWNDGAWGRPHRNVTAAQAAWYEHGYAGGLAFRERQQSDLAERTVVSSALPREVPAASRPDRQAREGRDSIEIRQLPNR
jgi:hypothetical protein